MTHLSVNLNKVALLRNTRNLEIPSVTRAVETIFQQYAIATQAAQALDLGVNAGHDLNLRNLAKFCSIPNILEVSIGHALIADALEMGLSTAVKAYLQILKTGAENTNRLVFREISGT